MICWAGLSTLAAVSPILFDVSSAEREEAQERMRMET